MRRVNKYRAWDKETNTMLDNEALKELAYNFDDESLEFMQYTGLKDKNERAICEGDILTNFGVTNDMKLRCLEIVWVDEYARFSARDHKANMNTSLMQYDAERCEVIGNIYENPQLLESTR
jgi:uncharacterized phage protein (TIGR01671 family)